MNLRLIPFAVVTAIAAVAFGATGASGGNGATVLTGQFASNEMFLVNGTPTLYTFTCNEQRVQRPDGSARDSAHCQLDPSETPPSSAAQDDSAQWCYESDFYFSAAPGFAGAPITCNWHGVVTPSGQVTMVADFPAS